MNELDTAQKAAAALVLAQAQQHYLRHLFHCQVVERPPGERLLFLAPHPDDIVIGCGGTVLRLLRDSVDLRFVYLTDGRAGTGAEAGQEDPVAEANLAVRRAEDARQVATRLGLPAPTLLGWNEHTFTAAEHADALVEKLAHELDDGRPDVVFVPYLWDMHPDHRYTNALLARALAGQNSVKKVYGYEVWSLTPPGLVVDISKELEEKKEIIRLHASQVALFDYPTFADVRARHHAPLAGPKATAGEVFCPFSRQEFLETVGSADLTSALSLSTNVLLTAPRA